jgi:porphobilinogen synthase
METEIYPNVRLNRLRQNKEIRSMLDSPVPGPEKFMWPIFIKEGTCLKEPVASLPGQYYYSIDMVCEDIKKVMEQGIKSILIFGVIEKELRRENAEYSYDENGLIQRAVRKIRQQFSNLVIFTDVGLTGYTTTGHSQVIDETGNFDNDMSLEIIKKVALSYAKAGASGVAPCGMIDGQVKELRKILDENGFKKVILMSYSSKFDTHCCRVFPLGRLDSTKTHKEYLTSHQNKNLAIRESLLDEKEGADILMVKPGLFYLDIIAEIRRRTNLPLATYNVSGEYAMIHGMIDKGFAELTGLVKESLIALNRAGADIIISYWANQYNKIFLE